MKDIIKGFILLREYPGCKKKKGDFEPYTSGEFLKYPEIWKPVYTQSYIRENRIDKIVKNFPVKKVLSWRMK